MAMARLFLGLDSSTQSLSALVIDLDARRVVYEASLNYDKTLPHYKTQNGTLRSSDPLVVHSPPLMWVEALDVLFARMQHDGVALGEILAVSGSGQQHGSVYWNQSARKTLANLNPTRPLKDNLKHCLARSTSPIWMDCSTAVECAEIRRALGGITPTAQATGSDTFERFTGPQIRKFYKRDPDGYAATTDIALVSSFMASVLAGQIAPIDHGDGAGMNLMDIRHKRWHAGALKATAPGLRKKLPPLAEPWRVIGNISPYFVKKYGFHPGARAVVWSGDNPCSLIGLGLIREGVIAVSLGTSDTLFGLMKKCRVDERGEGHVFGAPTGDYMTLICFKNGSLARERIRDMYSLDWDGFNAALAATPPGNGGAMMLPWFETEIVPRVTRPGLRRINLDDRDAAANVRAIVEGQMMAMRIHSAWMGVKASQILATGGASTNSAICQVLADVFNCPVQRIEISKSAALGAALRAAHAYLKDRGARPRWEDIVAGFTDPVADSTLRPNKRAAAVYTKLLPRYARAEQAAIAAIK
jgi:xylulokinase